MTPRPSEKQADEMEELVGRFSFALGFIGADRPRRIIRLDGGGAIFIWKSHGRCVEIHIDREGRITIPDIRQDCPQ